MPPEIGVASQAGAERPSGVLLTVDEAARRLGIGRTLTYRLLSTGALESVKVGRLRRIPTECLVAYIATLRTDQPTESADAETAA